MAYRAEVFHTFDADLNRSDLKGFATAISLLISTAAKIQADRVEQSVFGRAGGAPEYWGQRMAEEVSLFEMRRLESLSNTIFGVAMTLLAYDLPKGQISLASPDWAAIWHAYGSHLIALLLGFIVAGIFWLSHQRRLAYAPHASRLVVMLNLVFLLTIILLPATTGLYGTYWDVRDIVVLYGGHLMLISALNGILWVCAVAPRSDWSMLWGPGFSTFVFVVGLIVGSSAPAAPRFVWPFAFVGTFITSFVERKKN